MTLRDLIKMVNPKAQLKMTIVSENGEIVAQKYSNGKEWQKELSEESLSRKVLSAELNWSITGEDVHHISLIVRVKNRTNREMLIQALRSGPLDPEAREIILKHIEFAEMCLNDSELAACRGRKPEEVDDEICTDCKLAWLDREAET